MKGRKQQKSLDNRLAGFNKDHAPKMGKGAFTRPGSRKK